MGQGFNPNSNQIASAHHAEQTALEDQSRSVLPPHSKYFLSIDDHLIVPSPARNDRSLQPGLVPDAVYRPSALVGVDCLRVHVLSDLAKGALSRLACSAEVLALPDVRGNRFVREQFKGGNGSAPRYQEQFQANAEISN